MTESRLILPGDPEFNFTLGTVRPPNWRETAARDGNTVVFLTDAGTGIMRPATSEEAWEYIHGGEYDERLAAIDDDDDECGFTSEL